MEFPIKPSQNWFHSPLEEPVDPTFSYDILRTAWNSSYLDEQKPTLITKNPDGTTDVIFTLNPQNSSLLYTTLTTKTPPVESQSQDLLVAWPDNLFHNYVKRAVLKWGNTILSDKDSAFFDGAIQLIPENLGPGKREQYLRNIGNLTSLTKFQSRLPSTRLSFQVPWGWSRQHPLPIMLMTGEPLTMTYTLRPFPELLRVVQRSPELLRPRKEGDPIQIGPDSGLRMISAYSMSTPAEIVAHRSDKRYFILDWIESFDTPLINTTYPSRGLLIMGENQKALEANNRSDYGTDFEDSYRGTGPILTIQGMDANIFSNDEPLGRGLASPERPGYYFLPLTSDPGRYEAPGIISPGSLSITMEPGFNLKIRSWGYIVWALENGRVINTFA